MLLYMSVISRTISHLLISGGSFSVSVASSITFWKSACVTGTIVYAWRHIFVLYAFVQSLIYFKTQFLLKYRTPTAPRINVNLHRIIFLSMATKKMSTYTEECNEFTTEERNVSSDRLNTLKICNCIQECLTSK